MKRDKNIFKTKYSDNINSILPEKEPLLNKRNNFIPVCQPNLKGNEVKYLIDCIKQNWVSSLGSYVVKFENAFSRYCNVKFGVACSSGTTALHLALIALGIGKNDEVIVPTFTMIATANAVSYASAKPVFVDAHPQTWNIDPKKIEEKISRKTKAIIAVHIYGQPADMDAIIKIAKKHRLYIIEDAAEAHGAEYHGKKIGSLGDVACFSFYGNKIITTGEGGMLLTNNKKIAAFSRILRDHGFSQKRHFWHKYLSYNYRMTNLQAAVGLAQMERVGSLVAKHIQNARTYDALLKELKGITLASRIKDIKNVYWVYPILIEDSFGLSRNELRKILAKKGIETRGFFIPLHLQPIYHRRSYKGKFPVAEELCRKGMYLPVGANLNNRDIEFIAGTIKKAYFMVQDTRSKQQ